jgi:hypothetical protein
MHGLMERAQFPAERTEFSAEAAEFAAEPAEFSGRSVPFFARRGDLPPWSALPRARLAVMTVASASRQTEIAR